ncbi:cysteine-rich CWC family protein [Spongiibacter taiwanensis]|uniref:cysteine-rich CWC family protein n=1 Tax=Spongiibacter taiwanensis TaxID=1748242 RepID=UPI003D803060
MKPQNPNAYCPLCQGQNHCAIAAGLPAGNCWCMDTPISPAAREAAHLHGEGDRCLCSRCGAEIPTQYSSQASHSDQPNDPDQ